MSDLADAALEASIALYVAEGSFSSDEAWIMTRFPLSAHIAWHKAMRELIYKQKIDLTIP